jgi:cobalt-zinc-cadmium efflux system membrane fusion protein
MSSLLRLSLLVSLAVACTKGRDAPTGDTSKADSMAGMDMPGMDMGGKTDTARGGAGNVASEVRLTAQQIRHGGIAWQTVTMSTAAATATVPGQVVPNEDRTARLGAPAGGRIMAVRVRPGDRVVRGQLLVTMQSPEAGAAQSDLAKAQAEVASRRAEVAYAKSARDRAERLLALKAIPRQEYERAIADDELARSALAQAEAELRRARSSAAQLGAAASASGEVALRSPLTGVVLARTAVPGTVVEAGAPLAIVTDPQRLWLTIDAPEALTAIFRVGGELRFAVPAFPNETFVARIDAVGAGLDPDTRTLPVRATIDNRQGRLKPEMLATVSAEGGRAVAAAMLPDEAVQLLNTKTVVVIARPDTAGGARFAWREVAVGSRTGGRVAITRGLATGDLVVTKGAFAVKAEFQKGAMPKMEM